MSSCWGVYAVVGMEGGVGLGRRMGNGEWAAWHEIGVRDQEQNRTEKERKGKKKNGNPRPGNGPTDQEIKGEKSQL